MPYILYRISGNIGGHEILKFGYNLCTQKYWRNLIWQSAQPNLQWSPDVQYWRHLIWRFKPRPPNRQI